MSDEAGELTSEMAEACAELARQGFALSNMMAMIHRDALDKGLSEAEAEAVCLWILTDLRNNLVEVPYAAE